jgi:predicted nicotinamide N-methyase
MTEYIFDRIPSSIDNVNQKRVAIELGSGTGLVAIALATRGYTVFATGNILYTYGYNNFISFIDYKLKMLQLIDENVKINMHQHNDGEVIPKLLDWRDRGRFRISESNRFLWCRQDFELLIKCHMIIVVDCIYDVQLNSALFDLIQCLVDNLAICEIIFAIEERYCIFV